MNCKPGDLAVIVGTNETANGSRVDGHFVQVVRRAIPNEILRLSDGTLVRVRQDRLADWIVTCASPIKFKAGSSTYFTTIRPIGDRFLRPIRPGDISDEEVRDLYAPKLPEVA